MPELPPPPPPPLSLAGVLLDAWRRAVDRSSPARDSSLSPDPDAVPLDPTGPSGFGSFVFTGLRRPTLVAGVALAALVVAAAGWLVVHRLGGGSSPPEITLPRATVPSTDGPARADGDGVHDQSGVAQRGPVTIHAAGAVARPGVYRLPPGARVTDVLQAAGGPTADAEVDALNLAALLGDGQRVYVPRRGELPPGALLSDAGAPAAVDPSSASTADRRSPPNGVDLNTATLAELESLPGVGPATAEAILDHRRRRGRFRSVDELLEVRGIGPSRLEALRRRVRV